MDNEIMVSVCCLAYNHEPYIRDCLEGFVNQITDFKYEVLIHDDASTDKTAEIIREYEEKYPEIIKPIYQSENQWSKKVNANNTFIYPRAQGKYYATCEGDDFWCDEHKLQRQFDFMEAHPEYSACVHNTIKRDCRDGSETLISSLQEDADIPLEHIVERMHDCFQTSSVFLRKEFCQMPEKLYVGNFGDYQRAMYLALNGKIRFLSEVMSVYRFFAKGSWTAQNDSLDTDGKIRYHQTIIEVLTRFDEYSNSEHHAVFEKMIHRHQMNILVYQKKRLKILFSIKYLKPFLDKYDLKTLAYFVLKGKV